MPKPNESKRKRTFLVNHEGNVADTPVITGDIATTLQYIESYLATLLDGEYETFEITRQDMTQAGLDTARAI